MERSRQHLKRKFWDTPKPLFNPWRRVLRPCRPRHGIHFEKANQFGKFDEYVENNMYLDCKTKRAALVASPFVVCLTSYTGAQRLFTCSGTIVHSYGVDGEYFSIVLTSATLIRCPKKEDAIADDIKVESRSPASDAGISPDDIIIQIDGIHVESFLKFTSVLLDKAKEPFELVVKRAGSSTPLTLPVLPLSSRKLNRWPLPEEFNLRKPC